MKKTSRISRTLKRYSSLIGLFVLIYLSIKIGTTSYLFLTQGSPDVKLVPEFPESKQFSWYATHNLTASSASFLPFGTMYVVPRLFLNYFNGSCSNFSDWRAYGANVVLGRLATISVHGIIEFTGVMLMAVAGFMLWMWIAIALVTRKIVNRASHYVKRDFRILLIVGMILIILAAFIEDYLSWPYLFQAFSGDLFYSVIYFEILILFCVWIFFIRLGGWEQIKRSWPFIRGHKSIKMWNKLIKKVLKRSKKR